VTSRAHVELPTPIAPTYDGLFVAFEGGEGAGKSTQVALLMHYLQTRGLEVVVTREPGGTPAAEAMRDIVLNPTYEGLAPQAEALLFAAARGDHVNAVVLPALRRGAVVVTDRYLDSSVAYQGVARGLGRDVIEGLSLWATGGLVPDLTVVLDVEVSAGLGRVANPDRMESEPHEFHETVRRAFLGLAARAPYRYIVLDADLDRATIATQIATRVDAVLLAAAATS
jgi:dTMP kinase